MRLYAVFDANLYRGLPTQMLDDLRASEEGAGVAALASYWPTLELLARLGRNEQDRQGALNSIQRLVQHCGHSTPQGRRIRVQADEEVLLAGGLFGEELAERMQHHVRLAEFTISIAESGIPDATSADFQELLSVADYVAQSEVAFGRSMDAASGIVAQAMSTFALERRAARENILKLVGEPETLGLLARSRIAATAQRLGKVLPDHIMPELEGLVQRSFPVAMALLQLLLIKAVDGGVNWKRADRANSLWDLKLAFATSHGARIGGVPVVLVTEDRLLHDAAGAVANEAFVMRLDDYRALLSEEGVSARLALISHVAV